ncbi:hypothetical protein PYW08_016963 [Mythimna loreyi]|nr:hypothetical protein PYW08_016963 [Mythimna loreyi]
MYVRTNIIKLFQSWQDKKSKTKTKLANIRRQSTLTGGGPPPEPLNEEDQLILGTFSSASLVGHIDSNESIVEFIDLATPSTSKAGIFMAPPGTSGSQEIQDILQHAALPGTSQSSMGVGAAALPGTSGSREIQDVLQRAALPGTSQSSMGVGAAAHPGTSGSRGRSKKNTNTARCQQASIDVAEKISQGMEAKNRMKQQFYSAYLVLMAQQTEALATIARFIAAKSSPYI